MATYGKLSDVSDDRLRDRGALIPRWVAKHKTAEVDVSSWASPENRLNAVRFFFSVPRGAASCIWSVAIARRLGRRGGESSTAFSNINPTQTWQLPPKKRQRHM